jgi:phosphohistidine phosphatase
VPSLLLLRHAKSDWSRTEDDRDRPLAPRGRRGARSVGKFLARAGQTPDLAITSPAVRATETLRLAIEAGGWSFPVRESERLYGGGVQDLIDELRACSGSMSLVLAIGHEPTWSEAAAVLTGGSDIRMPTAAVCRIDFEVLGWPDVGGGAGVLAWLVTPRLLA